LYTLQQKKLLAVIDTHRTAYPIALVMPVGPQPHSQTLVRVTRERHEVFRQDNLSLLRFVPLVGAEGWAEHPMERKSLQDTVAEFVASQYGKDVP
jgi:hypothetical protein